jgi:putative FmdB family regulatory protein
MPIYEFYCPNCHRIYNFLSRAINPSGRPACPKCRRADLERKVSLFAISKGRKESGSEEEGQGLPDLDESRFEKAMEAMAGEVDHLDEDDPRQAARVMRKLFNAAGMPAHGGMEEALRRMEAGEDPEAVEEQLGDVLDEADSFVAGQKQKKIRRLARRLLPPSADPNLYEM